MGIALIDTLSGQFRDVNPRYTEIASRSAQEMKATRWMDICHPDDETGAGEAGPACGAADLRLPDGSAHARPDGEVVWIVASLKAIDSEGSPHHLCSRSRTSPGQKQSEALIWQQANFDTFDQQPNRRMFLDRLQARCPEGRRDGTRIAILFIDLDHFKEVNDTLGHHQGDVLLVDAARRIGAYVRQSDTVARLGGDEFTVILPELREVDRVEAIAQNIIDSLRQPFQLGQERAFVSASIGITLYPDDAAGIEDLLSMPTRPCIRPRGGPQPLQLLHARPAVAALNRMRLTNDLRGALKGEQLKLYFQPIVHLATGHIHKAEALIRWEHPQRGMVNPLEFLPQAEREQLS